MRTGSAILKNLKLLMRSKGSALVVLLAPLLIVIIIGVGFADTKDTKLSVGVYVPDRTELAVRFLENLNNSNNQVIEFQSEESCVKGIKEGFVLTCIVFPTDFVVKNDKQNEIKFYVDESRINLVYQIIASLQLNVNIESKEVSQELTARLLQILDKADEEAKNSVIAIVALKAREKSSEDIAKKTNSTMTALELGDESVDLGDFNGSIADIKDDFSELRNEAIDAVDVGYELLDNVDPNMTEAMAMDDALDDLNATATSTNDSITEINELTLKIGTATKSVDKLKSKLEASRGAKSSVISDMNTLFSNLGRMNSDLDAVKRRLESINTEIGSFKVTNADKIVNPITTKIEHVSAANSKITYSFPYLLMLVVLFVGIMLSSTLVFMEKTTRAFFRNYTTPTKSVFFIMMSYLTSIILLIFQVIVVLVVVFFALDIPVFTNILATGIIIILGINVFVLLGMMIGQLFNTSEAITMSTIAIGSVFIFLSNLILPLETLSPIIQQIARYNPYVITSEAVRKAMLFGTTPDGLLIDIALLLAYSIIIFVAVIIIKNVSLTAYFSHMKKQKTVIQMPEDHYLKIPEKNLVIKNIEDLVVALKGISDEEYDKLTKPVNIFSAWLKQNLKRGLLATRILKKKRETAIKIIEKYAKKK